MHLDMGEFLTTRQIQALLQVDRTTVYRMLSDGRLSGIKIGNRWRFDKTKINDLLAETSLPLPPIPANSFDVLPIACLQGMQSMAAEAIDLGAIITDTTGNPLTKMSHPCRFCQLIYASETGRLACLASFAQLAHQARFGLSQIICHAGLQCIGAAIRINGAETAVFIAGQYKSAAQPNQQRLQQLADAFNVDAHDLAAAAAEIPTFDYAQEQKVIAWLPKLTNTLSEIGQERAELLGRLQRIAAMSAVG